MSTPIIDLFACDSFEIEQRTLNTVSQGRRTRYIIPAGARISYTGFESGRAVLEVGGFKATTVRIKGPAEPLSILWDTLVS